MWTISRYENVSNSSVVQENQQCTSFSHNLFSDFTLVIGNEKSNAIQTNANNTNQGFFFFREGDPNIYEHGTALATKKIKQM